LIHHCRWCECCRWRPRQTVAASHGGGVWVEGDERWHEYQSRDQQNRQQTREEGPLAVVVDLCLLLLLLLLAVLLQCEKKSDMR
jgi:hypothetical protein